MRQEIWSGMDDQKTQDQSWILVGLVRHLWCAERAYMTMAADVRAKKTVPVAFMSRKLTESARRWVAREQGPMP